MSIRDFLMPDLGEGLTEGEIVRWLVAAGDHVDVDQPIAEISTAKAVVEVPTPFAGVVVNLHGAPGDVVAVGRPLISVDTAADAGESDQASGAQQAPASAAIAGPTAAESAAAPSSAAVASGESGNVLVGYGTNSAQRRRRRAGLLVGSGTVEAPAESPPPVGSVSGASPEKSAPAASTAAYASPPAPAVPATSRRITTPSSPLVRRLAAELGVDLASVSGTGPGGAVTRADLERAVESRTITREFAPAGEAVPERIRLVGPRRITAERLAQSHRDVPAASAWLTVDATELLALRGLLEARHPQARITPLALLLRLCVTALRKYPVLNAHFDAAAAETVVWRQVHLGVAVQAPHGLLVPVIRDAQSKSAVAIAAELDRLADAARDGSIAVAELTGSTFTVSNYGAFRVDGGIPIINPPEAAILGVGRISKRPWIVEETVVPRSVVELSLVFDHRVCDGGDAGGFLRLLGDLVEHPSLAAAEV